MLALDSALRGAGGALLLLLGCIVLRDARRSPAGLYGGLFAFGVVLGLLDDAPAIGARWSGWLLPLRLVKDGNPALFYLFAAACFADGFTLAGWQAALWLATVGLGALCRFGPWHGVWYAYDAVALLFSLLAVRLALVGRAVDLVEGRRRFRTVLVCVAAFYGVALAASGALLPRRDAAVALGLANAGGILAMAPAAKSTG